MGGLFGGSSSSSKNVNNGLLTNQLGSTLGQTGGASSAIAQMLGLGGAGTSGAQNQAFQNFNNSTGGQWGLQQGSNAITGNQAARGLLNSGSTLKALNTFGQNYGQTQTQNYLSDLFNLGNLGLGAGGILANSGQTQNQSTKPGLGGFIGQGGASFGVSDRRLKRDIERVGELPSGLPIYSYKYLWDDTEMYGPMADEVAVMMPEALGPVWSGYQTVDYAMIAG